MNHVIVSISTKSGMRTCGGRRTSNGWIFDGRSFEHPILRFSIPFISPTDDKWSSIQDYLAKWEKVGEVEEDVWNDEYTSFSEGKTNEFVLFMNSLGIPNTVFSSIGKEVEFGFVVEKKELSTTPGCPVKDLEDVKQLLLSCIKYEVKHNPEWVGYLIRTSTEDLAPFFKESQIRIECSNYTKLGTCNYIKYIGDDLGYKLHQSSCSKPHMVKTHRNKWEYEYIKVKKLDLYPSIRNVVDGKIRKYKEASESMDFSKIDFNALGKDFWMHEDEKYYY